MLWYWCGANTVIADQEADVYELFALFKKQEWDWVIRASDNRRVINTDGTELLLRQLLTTIPVSFSYKVKVGATKERTAHTALLNVKYTPVTIARSSTNTNKDLPDSVSVFVIELTEDSSTVISGEEPVHWVLLTTHSVETVEDAIQIIQWYCGRWNIEQLYRTDKTQGLNIEKAEAETTHGLANLAVLSIMAAVQVMTLVMGREGNTWVDAQIIFTNQEVECLEHLNPTLEGKTEKQKNQHPARSIAFAAWVIARLGGWTPYNIARPPGSITMIHGLVRFRAISQGFALRGNSRSNNGTFMGIP